MSSDPSHPAREADPQDGVAHIRPVTPEAMNEVAHSAAALADGVARHVVPLEGPRDESIGLAAEAVSGAGEAADRAGQVSANADDGEAHETGIARDAIGAVRADADVTAAAARDRIGDPAEEVPTTVRMVAANGGLSGSADALGLYNSVWFEIMQTSMAATGAHVAALAQARSLAEAAGINADHLRRRLNVMASQGCALSNLALTVALDALRPFVTPAAQNR